MLGENASRLPDLLLDNLKKVTAGYYSNARTLGRVTLSEDSVRAEDKYGNANENGNGDEDEDEDEDENENEEDGNEDTDGNGGVDDSSDKQEEEWDKVAIEFYRLTCAVIADPTILSDELMTSLAWFPISVSTCEIYNHRSFPYLPQNCPASPQSSSFFTPLCPLFNGTRSFSLRRPPAWEFRAGLG